MSNGLARNAAAPAARSSWTVAGLESPLRMTTGIAVVAGLAASWRKTSSPLVSGRRLSSRMRAGLVRRRRRDAVAAGAGRVQLDVREGLPEKTLDDQDVVQVIVDVQHDAAHGAGADREAESAWRSCPAATESSSRPSSERSSGLVR